MAVEINEKSELVSVEPIERGEVSFSAEIPSPVNQAVKPLQEDHSRNENIERVEKEGSIGDEATELKKLGFLIPSDATSWESLLQEKAKIRNRGEAPSVL
jgi:hypothetical protein